LSILENNSGGRRVDRKVFLLAASYVDAGSLQRQQQISPLRLGNDKKGQAAAGEEIEAWR